MFIGLRPSLSAILLGSLLLSASCGRVEDADVAFDPEQMDDDYDPFFERSTSSLKKGSGGQNGDSDYCGPLAPQLCAAGEGDCDRNLDCQAGLVCAADNGGRFLPPMLTSTWDVCVPPTCLDLTQSSGETGIDCGGPCGSCTPNCSGQGALGGIGFCSRHCKCAEFEGDCDSNAECQPGLVCGRNNGVQFGFAVKTEVCVEAHCANRRQDIDETGIDCGGADCGVCPSDATPPVLLGSVSFPQPSARIERAVEGDGDLAFFALGPAGLSIQDLSNPASPVSLGTFAPQVGGADCTDLVKVGDLVYLACGNHVACIDVSDPAQPTEVVSKRISGLTGAKTCAYIDGTLYVGAGADVRIYDVGDASGAPSFVGNLGAASGGESIVRVYVDGRRIYCLYGSGGASRLYVSSLGGLGGGGGGGGGGSPSSPQFLGVLAGPGNPTDLIVRGGVAYCAYNGAGLRIYDLRNVLAPQLLFTDGGSATLRIDVRGSTLACIYGDRRFAVADVSNPASLRLLTSSFAATVPTGVALFRNGFAFCGYGSGVQIFDTPPFVAATSPGVGRTGLCSSGDVDVYFSQPMNTATLDDTTLRVETSGGVPISGSVSASGTVATFDPSANLAPGDYRVTVAAGVRSARGAGLAPAVGYASNFTVGPYCVDMTSAPASATGGSTASLMHTLAPVAAAATQVLFSFDPDPTYPFDETALQNGTGGAFSSMWSVPQLPGPTTVYATPVATVAGVTYFGPSTPVATTPGAVGGGVIESGLVLHLDAANPASFPGSGGTWTDLSGSGFNASIGSYDAVAEYGGGLHVAASGGLKITVPAASYWSMSPASAGNTLEMWWKKGSVTSHGGHLIGTYPSSGGTWQIFQNALGYSGPEPRAMLIYANGSAPQYWVSNTTHELGEVAHLAVVQVGQTFSFYKNGAFVGAQTRSSFAEAGSRPLTLGTNSQGAEPADATYYQVRWYGRPLSAAEVSENFAETSARFGFACPSGVCTTAWDPATAGSNIVLSGANRTVSGTAGSCAGGVRATTSQASGRWYWEMTAQQDGGSQATRCPVIAGLSNASGSTRVGWYGYAGTPALPTLGGGACAAAPMNFINSGDRVGVAWDAGTGSVRFFKNGTLAFDCTVPVGTYFPFANHCNDAANHCAGTTNFGALPFVNAPPSGHVALP